MPSMPNLNEDWLVQNHGPLERLEDGLLTVAGDIRMPLGNFPRRMTVVALPGGRTLIWSAIPLREPEMQEIEALGAPAFLVVPGVAHRLDVRAWKKRYPNAKVVCAPGAAKAVREAAAVDATANVFEDPTVHFEPAPGVEDKEAVMIVRRDGRSSLVLNDILANVRHPNGLGATIMARLMGFGVDRPRLPWLGKWLFVRDRAALAEGFRSLAAEPNLCRIIVSHGDVIDTNPRQILQRIAEELSPARG